MSVSIKYKGAEIASASTEVTKTIKTAGKYCEADILVENTPDGGGSLPSSISKIDGGSFTPASNENTETYHISHNLGEIPKYAVVWTEELTAGTPVDTNYAVIYGIIRVGSLWFNPSVEYYAKVNVTGRTKDGYTQDNTNQGTQAQLANFASPTYFTMRKSGFYFKAGVTYKWLAWA